VEKALTQQELADLLGVSRQTVYYLEKGSYDPSLTLSLKIAEIFQKPIEEIFYFKPIIHEVLGTKTLDELEKVSINSGISIEKILKLKHLNDPELSIHFSEQELYSIIRALGIPFEDLFTKE